MKLKVMLAIAALTLSGTVAHAMETMDCCKDGTCTCCPKKPDGTGKPSGETKTN